MLSFTHEVTILQVQTGGTPANKDMHFRAIKEKRLPRDVVWNVLLWRYSEL